MTFQSLSPECLELQVYAPCPAFLLILILENVINVRTGKAFWLVERRSGVCSSMLYAFGSFTEVLQWSLTAQIQVPTLPLENQDPRQMPTQASVFSFVKRGNSSTCS
jgi:hypothetical protein